MTQKPANHPSACGAAAWHQRKEHNHPESVGEKQDPSPEHEYANGWLLDYILFVYSTYYGYSHWSLSFSILVMLPCRDEVGKPGVKITHAHMYRAISSIQHIDMHNNIYYIYCILYSIRIHYCIYTTVLQVCLSVRELANLLPAQ